MTQTELPRAPTAKGVVHEIVAPVREFYIPSPDGLRADSTSLLNWYPIRRLGVLSYSFYLLYGIVLAVVWRVYPSSESANTSVATSIMQGVIAFASTLAIAMVFHEAIEKPCARLRKRFSHD